MKYRNIDALRDYQNKLYFKNGYPQNQVKRNYQKLVKNLVIRTILHSLYQEFKKGFNLWAIFIIILSGVFAAYSQMIMCLIQLAFNLIMNFLRTYQQIRKALIQVDEYYKQTVYVINWDPRCHIEKKPKKDVAIGSLIFLKRHQPVPISILILNSQEEKFMISTWQKDGISNQVPKQSIKMTSISNQDSKNQTFIYFKRILTGKIEFDSIDSSNRQFRGFIKLQKDPKGEYLDYNNVITYSSVIYNTDWVVGIVIQNDDEDVMRLWNTLFKDSNNQFDRYLTRYSMLFCLLYLIQLAVNIHFNHQFAITLIIRFQQISPDYSMFTIVSKIFQSLTFVHPVFIIGLCEIAFQMFDKIFKGQDDIKISHSSALLNLTKVDHCIYDKTGTLTNINTILSGIIIGTHYYSLQDKQAITRKQTKQFYRLQTQTVNRNAMQLIEEEDEISRKKSSEEDLVQRSDKNNLMDFGNMQQSEKQIKISNAKKSLSQKSIKSRLQSQIDEAVSFNQEEAILNEEEDHYTRNAILTLNTHFIKEPSMKKIQILSKQVSSEEVLSSPEKGKRNERGRADRTGRTKNLNSIVNPRTPGFSGKDEPTWKDYSPDIVKHEENESDEESDSERKEIMDLIRLGHPKCNELMRAMILCQDVKTKYAQRQKQAKQPNINGNLQISVAPDQLNRDQQHFFNENTEEYQESVMKFAKIYGFEFNFSGILNKKICYEISAKGLREKYIVLKKLQNNDQFGIILEQNKEYVSRQTKSNPKQKQHNVKLYIKSENVNLLDFCNISQSKKIMIEKLINYHQQDGCRFIIYAGKQIDNVNFIKQDDQNGQIFLSGNPDTSIHSTQQSQIITTWDKELYENLEYYGIICLKEDYNEGALKIAKQLKSLDIPQWILSGDKKMQTISTGYQVGILNKENLLLRLDEEDEERLKLQMKSQLLFIRKQLLKETEQHQSQQQQHMKSLFTNGTGAQSRDKSFHKKKSTLDESMIQQMKSRGVEPLQKVCLLLNGKCIKLIFNDEYMKSHFLFIALILKTLIAYDCTPYEKELITESVNRVLSPQNTLMTISDSVDDFDMIQHAMANIQFINPKGQIKLAYSNIQVSNLQHLRQVIVYFAKILPMHLSAIVVFSCKTSLSQLIIYTMHVSIMKIVFIDQPITYLISLQLQIIIFSTLLCRYDNRSDKEQIELMLPQKLPSIYKCFKSNFRWLQELLYEVLVSASLVALLCTYIFNQFMTFQGLDSTNINHMMYIFQSFQMLGYSISYMMHQNVEFKQYIWSFLTTILLIIIGLSIEIDEYIRQFIINAVFKWQYIIGISSCIGIIVTVDQIVKLTREQMFSPKVILSFLDYIENPNKFVNDPYLRSATDENIKKKYNWKQFPVQAHIKISRKFFQNIKSVFTNVSIDPFIRSLFESEKTQSYSDEYSKYTLNFYNQEYEKQFRRQKIISYFQSRRKVVMGLIVILRIGSLGSFNQFNDTEIIIPNAIWLCIMILWVFINFKTNVQEKDQEDLSSFYSFWGKLDVYLIIPSLLIIDHFISVYLVFNQSQFYYSTFAQILYFQFLAWDIFPPPLIYTVSLSTLFELSYCIRAFYFYSNYLLNSESQNLKMEFIVLIVFLFVLSCLSSFTHYNFQRFTRLSFLFDQALKSQQEQTNQIVKLLLPAFIYEKIESDETQIEENQGAVSIIFLEICNFDRILQSKQRQVVAYLDDIFRVFDKICLQYGVQKIETVGKTYMACSGLKALELQNNKDGLNQRKINETQLALDISFDFFKSISEFKYQFQNKTEKLKLKIGIHYGLVIAGVIGYHKPQFSLIGDTVNTASRMCSTGVEGRITISSQAYERVMNTDYLFIEQEVEAKGKGVLKVYQVYQRRLNFKKRMSMPIQLKDLPSGMLNSKLMKNLKSTQLHHNQTIKQNDAESRQTILGGSRRSRLFSQNRTQQQAVKLIKRKNNNNENSQQSDGGKKKVTQNGYASIQEKINSDERRVRAKSQEVIKKDYTQQEWNESKEEQLEIKDIEWYPENRMLGINEIDADDIQELQMEKKQKDVQHIILNYNKLTLEYQAKNQNEAEIIQLFESYYTDIRSELKDIFVPFTIIFCLFKTQILLIHPFQGGYSSYTIRMFLFLYLTILYYIIIRLKKYKLHDLDLFLTALYYISSFLCLFFLTFLTNQQFLIADQAEAYLFAFAAVNQSSMKFKYMFTYLVIQQIAWITNLSIYGHTNLLLFVILCSIILLMVSHNNFELTIKNFNTSTAENLKKEQRDTLLTNLLPSHILTRFYQNNKIKLELSDVLTEATLLFADISGFTAYSSSVTAEQVVKMLRKLMTEFDKECLQQNVYKVYTIGDCYVVMGINNMEQRNPGQEARNVLEMGLQMVDIIKKVRKEIQVKDLNMRIGIHTGQFYGGIIGTDIVRYDIFGIDAVIANKMESQGEAARVMVSEDTMKLISNHFPSEYNFQFHKEVDVPVAKRKVKSYFVSRSRIDDSYKKQSDD